MTVKLSELALDIEVIEEDRTPTTVEEMIDEIKDGYFPIGQVYLAIKGQWGPNAKRMIQYYIENEADGMYEDWDERAEKELLPLTEKFQELMDQALENKPWVTDVYDYGNPVEIDVSEDRLIREHRLSKF